MSEHLGEGFSGSSPSDLRLILLGNIGCGKTASADTILGQLSPVSPSSSRSCKLRQGFAEGRSATLVEAPRFYWNGFNMEDSVRKETERAMTLVAPGPHAVLLLVPVCQFTEVSPSVVLQEYLQKEHPGLRQVIERCGGRYHVFNNRQRQNKEQVQELLEKEIELEKRVLERKRELMENFRVQKVSVVDTPDWFKSEKTPDEVSAQISSCVALSSPGPHAFLLCVPVDQPAKSELQALTALETVFGPEAVQKHTVVLFTYLDRLRTSGKTGGKSVEEYIASQRGDLVRLVEKCRDRFHLMEKGKGQSQKQNVADLLEKVEQTVKEAGGQCYSSPAFREAEERVRQRQLEIAREKKGIKPELAGDAGQLSDVRQPLAQINEEMTEDEIGNTRDEAEMSVSKNNLESLPPITLSTMSPSLLRSMMEKMESSAKMLPKLLANSSTWVGEGAKQVMHSPVWGKVGSGAQNVQNMVVDSSVWEKVGASAAQVSKAVENRVPQKVVDGSAWVGSGAKAVTASPIWEKVGSGAKLVAKQANNLAKSPIWGKVGSGAKTGAKLMADGSVKVGAGIGTGAKKMAQSPVWGKMSSGVKEGAKRVSESSVWEKMGDAAKQVPKMVIVGAILGLVLGVILAGLIGGAVGTAAGSAVSEVVRRKFNKRNTLDGTRNTDISVNNSIDDRKPIKTE
ncbi:hypothetical protein XENOCAPTIV_029386 [Xenoophorus captivus]|uniref:AIG1-type G domain-containing protein n=1 Tax=Xenoophorus captivus TaxID=1517983 RepID=A0ABV0QF46_9TELE